MKLNVAETLSPLKAGMRIPAFKGERVRGARVRAWMINFPASSAAAAVPIRSRRSGPFPQRA